MSKKLSSGPTPAVPQHGAPDVVHAALGVAQRAAGRIAARRVGQRALVELAGDGQRELVEHDDRARHRVAGQHVGERGPQRARGVRVSPAVAR